MTGGPTVFAVRSGRWATVLVVALGLLALPGCGRKGAPERPEGSEFPRQYPYYPEFPPEFPK